MDSVPNKLDALDRRNGNGSRDTMDDVLDEHSPFHNEWGSTAATTFNPSDTDGKGNPIPAHRQERFQTLYELHNGRGEYDRKSSIRQSYILNDAKTFMSVLEMPDPQRERVLDILADLDISSNNFGSRQYEKILLCICSLVADEALSERLTRTTSDEGEKRIIATEPIENRLFLTGDFRDLMDSTGMSSSEHRKIRQAIRERSDHF